MTIINKKIPEVYGAAFGAGILGALFMVLVGAVGRSLTFFQGNIELILGSILTGSTGIGTWILGFFWHLLNGGIFGLLYAAAIDSLRDADVRGVNGAKVGALLGLLQGVVAGIFLGLLPLVHPLISDRIAAPGYFGWNYGILFVLANLAVHMLYGTFVGAICDTARASLLYSDSGEEGPVAPYRKAG